ncbi:hypothetical protein ABNX05_10785 [Lysinibacillus sp. M3]|uniref:DUF3850 domain-containing protein n=1 Tax=Lysinibacillus zambalensis TaxID=3160866 RepID=A0ABV1MRG4_9BACI
MSLKEKVMFFSDNIKRTVKYMDDLSIGETVVRKYRCNNEYEIEILKNGHQVILQYHRLSTQARGHRSHYSFIDVGIIDHQNGYEIFNSSIYSKTINYNVKDEYKYNDEEIRLFLF